MNTHAPNSDQGDLKGGVRNAVRAVRRYFLLVSGLGADLFRQFRADAVKVLLASAASLLCQVSALGLLFGYLRILDSNQLFHGYAPRTSGVLFALVAILAIILFFGFALLDYRSNTSTLWLCHRYQKLGTQEVLSLASKLPHWFGHQSDQQISTRHFRQILSNDLSHRTRMARVLIRAVIPVIRLSLSAVVMLYINPRLSVFIILLTGVPLAGLYIVGKRIADATTSRETTTQTVFKRQMEVLSENWQAGTHLVPGDIDWDLALGGAESRSSLYFRRLQAKVLGKLLINTASTLGIMILILSLGYWLLQETRGNWSVWLTYLIALRYFLSSLNSVVQAVIQSARFSRQVQRLMAFIAAAKSATSQPEPLSAPCPDYVVVAYQGQIGNIGDDDDPDED